MFKRVLFVPKGLANTAAAVQSVRRHGIQQNAVGTEFESAFEMSASNIRYGPGVTKEVGFDFKNMKSKKVLLLTDPNLMPLPPVQQAMESLDKEYVRDCCLVTIICLLLLFTD